MTTTAEPDPGMDLPAEPDFTEVDPDAPVLVEITPELDGEVAAEVPEYSLDVVEGDEYDPDLASANPDWTSYEVQGRPSDGSDWQPMGSVAYGANTLKLSSLPQGEEWSFRIRAVADNGQATDWSEAAPLILPVDVTAPNVLSQPSLSQMNGVLSITWDGKDQGGEDMPKDFWRAEVWLSVDSAPAVQAGHLMSAGTLTLTGYPVGANVVATLTAQDLTGNRSGHSVPSGDVRIPPLAEEESIRDALDARPERDTTPPPVPAAPSLSMSMGAVIVRATGPAMPEDFSHYNVLVSPGGVEATITDPEGSALLYGKPAGLIAVRLVAVDISGNASDQGPAANITVVPIETAEQVREDLEQAVSDANTAIGQLDTRTTQARMDLDDARDRLQQAETTLAPLPGDLADAKTAAGEAADAAIAAEARATEANNRAMTRLANGNFEDGLKYWDTSYGAGPGLTTDSHSGGQAAWFGSNRAVTPESYLPVVEGQIWELQYYYKARNEDGVGQPFYAIFQDQDGERLIDWVSNYDASLTEWKNSGAVRYTVGPDVDAIRPYIGRSSSSPLGAEWIIDDVVLRDVTDVVRLEQAAQAAASKADQAQSKADFVELQLDGVSDRLDTAEGEIDRVESEAAGALSDLDTNLTNAFLQADSVVKSEAASDAQEKADAARAHANMLLSQAENVIPDPHVEVTSAWKTYQPAVVNVTSGFIQVPAGSNTFSFALTRDLNNLPTSHTDGKAVPVTPGEVWEFSAEYRTSADYALASSNYSGIRLGTGSNNAYIARPAGQTSLSADWVTMKGRWTVPDGVTSIQVWVFQSHTAGTILWRNFSAKNVTELVAAESAAQSAQDRADDAHTLAGTAASNASAAMSAASGAQSTADNLPKVLHGTTAPSGTAPNGSIWWQHKGSLQGVVIGQWNRVNGSWVSTPIDSQAVANLDVGKLTAGSAEIAVGVAEKFYVGMLAANDVFARRMVVSDGANLVPNPRFENDGEGWAINENVHLESAYTAAPGLTYRIMGGSFQSARSETFGIEAGERYLVGVRAFNDLTGPDSSSRRGIMIVYWYKVDGSASATASTYKVVHPAGWGDYSWEVQAPSDATMAAVRLYTLAASTGGRFIVTRPTMTRMTGTTLIEPGAVTADKITVTDKLITDIFGANRALIEDELVVKGKLIANNATLISAAMKSLTVTEKATFATAFADEFYTQMLAANKVFARQMTISPGNLIVNPKLEDDGVGWFGFYSASYRGEIYDAGGIVGLTWRMHANGTSQGMRTPTFPIDGDSKYRLTFRSTSTANSLSYARVYFLDENFQAVGSPGYANLHMSAHGWADQELVFTAPTNAKHAYATWFFTSSATSGHYAFGIPSLNKMVGAVHIEDGAITAEKMNFVSPVEGGRRLRLDSDGLLLETTGGRSILRLDQSGLRGYKTDGVTETFSFDPATGQLKAVDGKFSGTIDAEGTVSSGTDAEGFETILGTEGGLTGVHVMHDGARVGSLLGGLSEGDAMVNLIARHAQRQGLGLEIRGTTAPSVSLGTGHDSSGGSGASVSADISDASLNAPWSPSSTDAMRSHIFVSEHRVQLAGNAFKMLDPATGNEIGDIAATGKWQSANLVNGWTRSTNIGGPVQYRREGSTVRLAGVLTGSTTAAAVFRLPQGMRPTNTQVPDFKAWTTQAAGTYRVEIRPDGYVAFVGFSSAPSWISLDGITFHID